MNTKKLIAIVSLVASSSMFAVAPRAGDLAPDFELTDPDGTNPVRLSDFRGHKPVAIVFGSFT